MVRARLLLMVLIAACTPIRPLSSADGGGVDAATRDARVGGSDGGTGDAGCGTVDRCDGADDDCDPTTPDGSGDPRVGAPCDGPDPDLCEEGVFGACVDGGLTCSDATGDTPEQCTAFGADEDCDGMVDEAGAIGARTFYLDEDGDGVGTDAGAIVACRSPPAPLRYVEESGDCDDADVTVNPRRSEECDAVDDDCNGMIDDGMACSDCTVRAYGGHTYLFCNTARPWETARSRCAMSGYHLAVVEDAAENGWLSTEAASLGLGTTFTGGVWIGLRRGILGTFEWTDGTPLGTYHPWNSTEPDMNGDCVRFRTASGGTWFDSDCGMTFDFVCEAP